MYPRDCSLHVWHLLDSIDEVSGESRMVHEILHGVQSGIDRSDVRERDGEPYAEQSFAERRDTSLEELQERAVDATFVIDEDLVQKNV